jgi:Cell division protein FtsI/penicillin-binding protein 2
LDRFSSGLALISGFMFCSILAIIINLANLMVVNNDKNQQAAASQQLRTKTISADRGTIMDINGQKLVQSAAAWVVYLEPGTLTENYSTDEREEICHILAEILDADYDFVLQRSYFNANPVKITIKADRKQKDKLDAYIFRDAYIHKTKVKGKDGKEKKVEEVYFTDMVLNGSYSEIRRDGDNYYIGEDKLSHEEHYHYIKGVYFETDTKRYYYHNTPIAANVLGYTNFDNEGSQGLENYYDGELKGVDGKQLTAANSVGGDMQFEYNANVDAIPGNDITLTIDANIQTILEKYLREAVKDNDVRNRGAGIIMNVNTGAILAMSTMPDYDPEDYKAIADENVRKKIAAIEDPDERNKATIEAQQEQWKNKAVNDTYEPGSVFKPITMSSALEEGVTNMDDTFNCPGYHMVGKKKIKCANRSGHGHETLTQAMMNSCNPVHMELGERLGVAKFSQYFKAYGLTAATGIDLPGESAGLYHKENEMTKLDLAESAFGQSMTVTPIQLITAISAVVNGGYLVQPYVVDKITDPNGNIIKAGQTVIKRQVISEETSAKMRDILEATANKGGTAHNVYLPGYRIGGKTGTSEKIAKQAATNSKTSLYVASFCGIAPIDNPEVAVLIVLDEPAGSRHSGGTIAAPVVRGIFSELLPYLGVDTIYSEEDMRLMDVLVPNVVGQSTEDAKSALEKKGFTVRVLGSGDKVAVQVPAGAKSAPKSCTVVLSTESDGIPTTIVPDLVGRSPSEVAYAVKNKNLNIRYTGNGYESSSGISKNQDPPAGSEVKQGTVVTVEFNVDGIND